MKTSLQDFSSLAEQILSEMDHEHRDTALIGSLFIASFLGINTPGFEPVRDLARRYAYLACESFDRDRSHEWGELTGMLDKIRWMLEDIRNCDHDSKIRQRFVFLGRAVVNLKDYLNSICLDNFDESDYRNLVQNQRAYINHMESVLGVLVGDGNSQHKCRCGNGYFYAHQLCRHDIIIDGDGHFEDNIEIYDSEKPYGTFTCTACGVEYEELSEIPEAPSKDESPTAL